MLRLIHPTALCLIAFAACFSPAFAQAPANAKQAPPKVDPAVEAARKKVVTAINSGDAKAFFALLNTEMRQVLPLKAVPDFISGVRSAKGQIRAARAMTAKANHAGYLLTAERGEWALRLDVDSAGLISGLLIQNPPDPSPVVASNSSVSTNPAVAASKVPLGLPMKGRWLVFWGGDKPELNHHLAHKSQRRAADLVMTGADGKSHRTNGKVNADYFCFGQEIFAVADGKVIVAIDGVPDNLPGAMNPYIAPGNMVIIEHDPKLFSVYCHLQRGTLQVKLDDPVHKGQLLGLCGNSGNSSEAHLHFQLQDGPHFESSLGIEAIFDNISTTRDGSQKNIPKYRFLKGDLIEAGS